MQDLRQIIARHRSKKRVDENDKVKDLEKKRYATTSDIPDLFFDDILVRFKLNRIEILVLMYLYRVVWCRPNLYREHGITPVVSHSDLEKLLNVEHSELSRSFHNLENLQLIETIKAGQYFVRKYFVAEHDKKYGQSYDNFL